MIGILSKQDILNNAPEGATHYEFYNNFNYVVFFKDVKDNQAHQFFEEASGWWLNCAHSVLDVNVHEIKPSKVISNSSATPSTTTIEKAKTVTVKVMLFDKPYEFTVCYYTESFDLVSAFENKMNQSVMWNEDIKKLIINEIKEQPKASDKIKYKESLGDLSIKMEFTTIDDLLHYLRETKEATEIKEPESNDAVYLPNDHLTRVAKGVNFDIQRVYEERGGFWIVECQNGLIDFRCGAPCGWEDFKCVFYYEEVLKEQENLNIAPFKPKSSKEPEPGSRVYLNNVISIDKDESDNTINIDRAGQLGVLTFNKDEVTIENTGGL